MATNIYALNDKITISKKFTSGKDRIAVNDEVLFEGKLEPDEPQSLVIGDQEILVEARKVSKLADIRIYQITILEQGQQVFSGLFDQQGKELDNETQAKGMVAAQVCGMIGAVIGVTLILSLSRTNPSIPGGAVGGALGGGLGGALGGALGTLLFKRRG